MDIETQIKRLEAAAEFCKELAEKEAVNKLEQKNNQLKLKYAKQQLMLISVELDRMLK